MRNHEAFVIWLDSLQVADTRAATLKAGKNLSSSEVPQGTLRITDGRPPMAKAPRVKVYGRGSQTSPQLMLATWGPKHQSAHKFELELDTTGKGFETIYIGQKEEYKFQLFFGSNGASAQLRARAGNVYGWGPYVRILAPLWSTLQPASLQVRPPVHFWRALRQCVSCLLHQWVHSPARAPAPIAAVLAPSQSLITPVTLCDNGEVLDTVAEEAVRLEEVENASLAANASAVANRKLGRAVEGITYSEVPHPRFLLPFGVIGNRMSPFARLVLTSGSDRLGPLLVFTVSELNGIGLSKQERPGAINLLTNTISSVEDLDASFSQKDTLNVAKMQLTELNAKEYKVKWQEQLASWVQTIITKTGAFDADGCIEILEDLNSEQRNWLLQTVTVGATKAAEKNTAASTVSIEEHFTQTRLKDLIEALLSSEVLVGAIQDRARTAKDLLNASFGDLLSRTQDTRERKERFDKEEQAYAEARKVAEAYDCADGIDPLAKEIEDSEGWNDVYAVKEERKKRKHEAAATKRQGRQDPVVEVPHFITLNLAYTHQPLIKNYAFLEKIKNKTGARVVFRNSASYPSGTRPASADSISVVGSTTQCSGAIKCILRKLPAGAASRTPTLKEKRTTKRQQTQEAPSNFRTLNLVYQHQQLIFGEPVKQMQKDLGVTFVFSHTRDCPRGTRPNSKDALAIIGGDLQIEAAIQKYVPSVDLSLLFTGSCETTTGFPIGSNTVTLYPVTSCVLLVCSHCSST